MTFNWKACKEIAPDKYIVYILKHVEKDSVYNAESYPTREAAQQIIDFEELKNAKVESMIVSRYRDKRNGRADVGEFE